MISSFSVSGRDAGPRQHRLHVVDEVVAQQLAARHVDRRRRAAARSSSADCQDGELARRVLQHVEAELHDQPALLGGGDELRRRDAAVQRMLPARQRLEAGDRVVLEPHDRLVDDVEAAGLERLAQLACRGRCAGCACRRPARRTGCSRRRSAWPGRPPPRRCRICSSAVPSVDRRRDADRGRQEDVAVADRDGGLERAHQLARHLLDRFRIGLREHDHARTNRPAAAPACPARRSSRTMRRASASSTESPTE